MTPIERAARAICVTFGYDPDSDDQVGLGEPGDVNWNMFEDHVRAVLTAIREPSEAMVKAAQQAKFPVYRDGKDHGTIPRWQAMIDAMLAESLSWGDLINEYRKAIRGGKKPTHWRVGLKAWDYVLMMDEFNRVQRNGPCDRSLFGIQVIVDPDMPDMALECNDGPIAA